MARPSEERLWQLLAWSFIVGGGGPLIFDFLNFLRVRQVDAEGLKIGVWCSFTLLAGITGLVASRIFTAVKQGAHSSRAWTVLGLTLIPLGAIIVEWVWQRTMSIPVTLNQKAAALAGGFIFVAGIVITVGERVLHSLRTHEAAAPTGAMPVAQ